MASGDVSQAAVEMGHIGTSLQAPSAFPARVRRRAGKGAAVDGIGGEEGGGEGEEGGEGEGLLLVGTGADAGAELLVSQIEWYMDRLRFKMNKGRMYRLLFVWLIGVVCSVAVLFLLRDGTENYHMQKALTEALVNQEFRFEDAHILKNFEGIDNSVDFWAWVHGPVLDALEYRDGHVLICTYNRLLGSITMRQHRVRAGAGCEITRHMAELLARESRSSSASGDPGLSDECYADYNEKYRSEEPFGPNNTWTFQHTPAPSVSGFVSSYEGSGFIVNLPHDPEEARTTVEYLENNSWIDKQTRAVVVSVNTFNPNVNAFLSSVFLVEFPAGGDAMVDVSMRPLKADFYFRSIDWFRLVLELVFLFWLVAHVIMYIVIIVKEARAGHSILEWIMNPWWNFVCLLSLALYIIATVWYLLMLQRNHAWVQSIQSLTDERYFETMESAAMNHLFWVYFSVAAISVGILSVFRYLNFNKRMSLLWLTIERAGGDLMTFFLFFAIVFLAFVIAAHLIYGTNIFSYSSFAWALLAGLRGVFGDIEYDDMFNVQRYITPLYFVLFMIVMIFVLLNMFIAIITDAYSAVNEEAGNTPTLAASIRKYFTKKASRMKDVSRSKKPPEISTKQLLSLLRRTRARLHKEKLTKAELACWPGWQDMPPALFEYLWQRLSTATATTKTEAQVVGLGEKDDEDEDDEGGSGSAEDGAEGATA